MDKIHYIKIEVTCKYFKIETLFKMILTGKVVSRNPQKINILIFKN